MINFIDFQKNAINYIKNNNLENKDDNLGELLFPFIEVLNYDVVDPIQVVSKPIYIEEDDEFFDYGLIEDYDNKIYKSIIKVFPFGADIDNFESLVDKAFKLNINTEYAILTDCINFIIFKNEEDGTYKQYYKINILEINNEDEEDEEIIEERNLFIEKMEAISKNNIFHFNTISDDESYNEDLEYEDEDESEEEDNKKYKKPIFTKGKKILIGFLTTLIILTFLIGKIIQIKNNSSDDKNNEPNEIVKNKEDSLDNDLNDLFGTISSGMGSNIGYIELKPVLELNLDKNINKLFIKLISNIKPDAIIKFEIINSNGYDIIHKSIDDKGVAEIEFDIPKDWDRNSIQVVAYLDFEDENNQQPDSIKNYYGKLGEKIVPKDKAPKYGLTFQEVDFDNKRIDSYKDNKNTSKLTQTEKDFENTEIRTDSNGNFRIKPKGFDLDKVNIRENRSIYPEIVYSTKDEKAYLQIVIGFIDTQWGMFENVGFIVDGNTWSYPVNSNIKKTKVAGINLAEWAYFNNYDSPRLEDDMILLANSHDAEIIFTGASRKSHIVTLEEKENIRQFLNLFNQYYKDNFINPNDFKN